MPNRPDSATYTSLTPPATVRPILMANAADQDNTARQRQKYIAAGQTLTVYSRESVRLDGDWSCDGSCVFDGDVTWEGPAAVVPGVANANEVFAGDVSGGVTIPYFRALVPDDIPDLDAAKITTGVMDVALLGTGTLDASHYLDGTGAFSVPAAGLSGYDIQAFVSGVPGASQIIYKMIATRNFTLPASLVGSYAHAGTTSTGSVAFDIQKNGSSGGYAAFSNAGGHSGTFTYSSDVSFTPGDILQIVAPASPDATLANVAITLKVTLT